MLARACSSSVSLTWAWARSMTVSRLAQALSRLRAARLERLPVRPVKRRGVLLTMLRALRAVLPDSCDSVTT